MSVEKHLENGELRWMSSERRDLDSVDGDVDELSRRQDMTWKNVAKLSRHCKKSSGTSRGLVKINHSRYGRY